MDSTFYQYVLRLVFALFVGGLIGIEREVKGKPAGMRTNMLMCMGSCLLMILSIEIFNNGMWVGDPSRIAACVVTGIGFLGAGTIIQSRFSVAGLTSAATLWFVAAIGMTIGLGNYAIAATAMVLTIVTLSALGSIERIVSARQRRHLIQLQFPDGLRPMQEVKACFADSRVSSELLSVRRERGNIIVDFEYDSSEKQHLKLVSAVDNVNGVEITVDY
jgi:putative Mg2+ transporter-C (MgtC) family protein